LNSPGSRRYSGELNAQGGQEGEKEMAEALAEREQAIEDDEGDIADSVPKEEVTANAERLMQIDFEAFEFADLRIKIQFPDRYPHEPCRLELSSKTLPKELVHKLSSSADGRVQSRASEGKRHAAEIVEYLRSALRSNRLAPAFEELRALSSALPKECLSTSQKAGEFQVTLDSKGYNLSFKLAVPANYPISKPKLEITKHNFPKYLIAQFEGQANEIAKKYEEGNLTVDETRMQQQTRPAGLVSNSASSSNSNGAVIGERISVPTGPANRSDSSQKANKVQERASN